MVGQCCKSFHNFEWIEDTFQFNEDLLKNYNDESDKGYFIAVELNILKNYKNFIMTYHFYLRGWLKKSKS